MIEFQLRVSKAVTIWSEIAVREKSRGGRAQRGDGRREPHVHSSTRRLEVTSRVTIGVLALASGVYTYLGVRELLNGNTTTVFFAAVIYSVAVTIGIFAFWSFLMRLLPHVLDHTGRFLLFLAMLLGSVMIIAMSAWLNASALAGAAALEQHLGNTLQSYSRDLDQA